MRVAVIGQGYVGLTISMGALSAGHDVVGIDLSPEVINSLNAGKSHIEGITDIQVSEAIKSARFNPSTEYALASECEVVVIAVPTPLNQQGKPDLDLLCSAAKSLGGVLKKSTLIINESTSHPGTLREIIKPLVENGSSLAHRYAISPERVDPGNQNYGTRNTPRIVGALDNVALQEAIEFYSSFCDVVIPVSSPEVAESAKLFENTFRFINIGLVNEFSQLMSEMGIPAEEVLAAAATKPYGFMPFHPNVGIGGHCIPVDPLYLQAKAEDLGLESKYISLSQEINQKMPSFVAERLNRLVGDLNGKHVLLVGVAYKANVADTRETPAESFIKHLRNLGAKVSWHDPLVTRWHGEESSPVAGDYDMAVVLVAHDQLDLKDWNGNPIYTTIFNSKHGEWKPLISVQSKAK